MLKDAVGVSKIYIACGYTDLRLGIDGLAFLIQEKFHLTPTEKGTLFLFCGRKSDRIKGLYFEGGNCSEPLLTAGRSQRSQQKQLSKLHKR